MMEKGEALVKESREQVKMIQHLVLEKIAD